MGAEASAVIQTVGRYDLLEKIAEGGMGTVYRGRSQATGEIVAVKLVAPQMANNEVFRQRFEKEYNVARSLDHPNIVRALDFGHEGGRAFLVMEFVEGESLGARLEREKLLPEPEAVKLIGQAAQGLQAAHQRGLVHRDIKPDNILVTRAGQVKIADMGLVKELDTNINLTRTGRGLGTPHFMAPEQFRDAKNADVRCDIYSLAATLYMMVTGQMPFQALGPLEAWMKKINNDLAPPRKVNKNVTERTDAAIRRGMSADPDQRPSSCAEFMEDLTGKSTRRLALPKGDLAPQDLWYLIYKDEDGVPHMVKGTAVAIRRSLKEGLLGDASNVRAGRTKQGSFESLRNLVEFRDLVPEAAAPRTRPKAAPQTPPVQSVRVTPAGARRPASPAAAQKSDLRIPMDAKPSRIREWVRLGILIAVAVGISVALTLWLHG